MLPSILLQLLPPPLMLLLLRIGLSLSIEFEPHDLEARGWEWERCSVDDREEEETAEEVESGEVDIDIAAEDGVPAVARSC
jgi:hypothetical protein